MPMLFVLGIGEFRALFASSTRSLSGYTMPILVIPRDEAFDFSVLVFDADVVLLLLLMVGL